MARTMSSVAGQASYFEATDLTASKVQLEEKPLTEWDNEDVCRWIGTVQAELDQAGGVKVVLEPLFREHNITGMVLQYLTNELLQEMGLTALKTRLIVRQKIDQLLLQNALVNKEVYSDLQIDAKSLITSVSLLETIAANFKAQGLDNYMRLNDQFFKLREDLLPVFKWIKDHKPLPTPEITKFANSSGYWGSQPNSASSPTKGLASLSSKTSQATSPVQMDSALASSSSVVPLLSSSNSNSSNNLRSISGNLSSSRRKSVLSPSDKSNFSPIANSASLSTAAGLPSPTTTLTGGALGGSATGTGSATAAASSASNASALASSRPQLNHAGSQLSVSGRPQLTPSGSSEPLKQLRLKTDDPCYKILQHAMRRHGILNDDWRKYALVICYGDQERVLELNEKPVVVFRELQEQGQHPAIMLRQIDYNDDDETINATPGGRI